MNNALPSQRLPPLKSLQVFEAVARHASVTRAADELHVTQGAVSRQVRQLEDSLGLSLFERRNRGVHLTAQGAQLQQACAQALQALGQAVDAVRHQVDTQPLVLSCEPTLAMHWLIPRLARFQAQHPQIALHLVAAGGAVDFARDRIDLAVRRSDIALQPHWQVDAIAPEYMGLWQRQPSPSNGCPVAGAAKKQLPCCTATPDRKRGRNGWHKAGLRQLPRYRGRRCGWSISTCACRQPKVV